MEGDLELHQSALFLHEKRKSQHETFCLYIKKEVTK